MKCIDCNKEISKVSKRCKICSNKNRKGTYHFTTNFAENQAGKNNPNWKGLDAKYVAVHKWIKENKGTPNICENCNSKENVEWANKSHKYLRKLTDYIALCRKCHRAHDMGRNDTWLRFCIPSSKIKKIKISGVQIKPIKLAHSDERRDILEIFNGGFTCKQIKVLKVKAGQILGNHYHKYKENRYLLQGKIQYYLKNIKTNEEEKFIMDEGEIMTTDAYIVHTGEFLEDSIIIEGTEEQYIDAKHNDVVYILKENDN